MNKKEQKMNKLQDDLRSFRKFGLTLLQLAGVLAVIGIVMAIVLNVFI